MSEPILVNTYQAWWNERELRRQAEALAADRLKMLLDHEGVLVPRDMGQVWRECLHCENDIEQGHTDDCKLLKIKQ